QPALLSAQLRTWFGGRSLVPWTSHHHAFSKFGSEWQFGCGQGEGFLRDFDAYTFDLEQHFARLDLRYPVLNVTFTATLTNFKRLLGNGLIGEYANPHFAATFDVTGKGTTRRFQLTRGQTTTANG